MTTTGRPNNKRQRQGTADETTARRERCRRRLLGGKTITGLAAASGVSLPHVSLILSGRRGPSLDVAYRLAKAARLTLVEWHRLYVRLLATR